MTVMVVAHPIPGFNGRQYVDDVALTFVGGFAKADVPTGAQADLTARGYTLNAVPASNYDPRYVTQDDLETPTSAASVALKAAYGTNAVRQRLVNQLGTPILTGAPGICIQASNSTSATGFTFRTTCQTAVACSDIRVMFPWGWTLSATAGDVIQTQSIPYKLSVELANGVTHPVTFRGARSATNDPGGTLISDPVGVDLPAGAVFALRWFNNVNTSGIFTSGIGGTPMDQTTVLNATPTLVNLGSSTSDGYSTSDITDSGAAVTTGANNFGPPIVLGQAATSTPVLFGFGDSITAGKGDFTAGANSHLVHSWFTRGAGSRPSLRCAITSLPASVVVSSHLYSAPLLELATDAIVMLGINDLVVNSVTATALKASLTSIFKLCASRGLRVWGCTLLPRTTSTDSWATMANQTVSDGPTGARIAVNDWIRAGADGLLTGHFDTADTVETARNSGLWITNGTANAYTVDGTHPSPLGHATVAEPLHAFAFPAP